MEVCRRSGLRIVEDAAHAFPARCNGQMVGSIGEAMEDFSSTGRIWIHGESWNANIPEEVKKGQKVEVISQDGLTLNVKIIQEDVLS